MSTTTGAITKGIGSSAQIFALLIGTAYLLSGVAGFATEGTGSGELFGILGVNMLHNIIHVVVFGALWVVAAFQGPAIAKMANLGLGAALLAVCLLGLVGALGWLNIDSGVNEPHFWLTIVTGLVAIYFGTAGANLGGHRTE